MYIFLECTVYLLYIIKNKTCSKDEVVSVDVAGVGWLFNIPMTLFPWCPAPRNNNALVLGCLHVTEGILPWR